MNWNGVGSWIKDNAGPGAALVGSLLTGNVPGAVAAGVALVSGATGTNDPGQALEILQSNPDAAIKLKELYFKNEDSIRNHIETMEIARLENDQKSHHETQETIRHGDSAKDRLVRWTRPLQSWLSLLAAIFYIFSTSEPNEVVIGALLTLPFTFFGLRQVSKFYDSANLKRAVS